MEVYSLYFKEKLRLKHLSNGVYIPDNEIVNMHIISDEGVIEPSDMDSLKECGFCGMVGDPKSNNYYYDMSFDYVSEYGLRVEDDILYINNYFRQAIISKLREQNIDKLID